MPTRPPPALVAALVAPLVLVALAGGPFALSGGLLGAGTADTWGHTWGYWWVVSSLEQGALPLWDAPLRHPEGQAWWVIDLPAAVAVAPVTATMGAVAAWHAALLGPVAAGAGGVALWLQRRGVSGAHAAAAGVLAATSPFVRGAIVSGVPEALVVLWTPLYALLLEAALARGGWRVVAAGLAGAVLALEGAYGAVVGVLVGLACVGEVVWSSSSRGQDLIFALSRWQRERPRGQVIGRAPSHGEQPHESNAGPAATPQRAGCQRARCQDLIFALWGGRSERPRPRATRTRVAVGHPPDVGRADPVDPPLADQPVDPAARTGGQATDAERTDHHGSTDNPGPSDRLCKDQVLTPEHADAPQPDGPADREDRPGAALPVAENADENEAMTESRPRGALCKDQVLTPAPSVLVVRATLAALPALAAVGAVRAALVATAHPAMTAKRPMPRDAMPWWPLQATGGADLASFVVPAPLLPLTLDAPTAHRHVVFIGVALLSASLVALRWRRSRGPALLALAAAFLALGPVIRLWGEGIAWSPPGAGLAALGARNLYRLAGLAPVAGLAAIALALHHHGRALWAVWVAIALEGLLLAPLPVALPTTPDPIGRLDRWLADEPGRGAVLDLPFDHEGTAARGPSPQRTFHRQTAHSRPLASGLYPPPVARGMPGALVQLDRALVAARKHDHQRARGGNHHPPQLDLPAPPPPAARQRLRDALRSDGFSHVALDLDAVPAPLQGAWRHWTTTTFGAPDHEDGLRLGWRL